MQLSRKIFAKLVSTIQKKSSMSKEKDSFTKTVAQKYKPITLKFGMDVHAIVALLYVDLLVGVWLS